MLKSKTSHRYRKTSYSQSGEDLIVQYIFLTRGIDKPTYIDIGAYHPFKYNNTAIFYEKGSKGINIEPNPEQFSLFKKYRPRDTNLNIGISSYKEQLDYFFLNVPTLNTFSAEAAKEYASHKEYYIKEVRKIPTFDLNQVLIDHFNGETPDFISIDVEGFDFEIVKSINWNLPPKVICVETISFSNTGRGGKDTKIIEYIQSNNFLLYADTNINSIFVKKEFWRP